MRNNFAMLVGCFITLWTVIGAADTLVLKDGRVLQGTYTGGNTTTITFKADGNTATYPIETISSLTFFRSTPSVSQESKEPAPQPTSPAVKSTQGPITVPAGTQLMIRTQSSLQTGKTGSGDRFTASLEANLVVDNTLIAGQGSTVYGRVVESVKARRVAGKAKLVLELTDIMIDGQLFPIITDQIGYEGERSGTLKKIALGAATGGVIDGKDGARTGAAVGAGAAVITKGKQIEIPAESILGFRITQSFSIQ